MFSISLRGYLIGAWARRCIGVINGVTVYKALTFTTKAGCSTNVINLHQDHLITFFISFIGRLYKRTWNIVLSNPRRALLNEDLFRLKFNPKICEIADIDCVQIGGAAFIGCDDCCMLLFWLIFWYWIEPSLIYISVIRIKCDNLFIVSLHRQIYNYKFSFYYSTIKNENAFSPINGWMA